MVQRRAERAVILIASAPMMQHSDIVVGAVAESGSN